MGKINVLPFSVANLIAAGEVVDRPASVVKELTENAIDAGAKQITVEIKNGGISFIRVTDDGCGMDAEDLPIAVRRHATSKIHDAADLENILTLGFRGEALAAIASVSQMRLLSKRREEQLGTLMEVNYGDITDMHEAGCPDGTTVIAEALFSNVPARRKFLKKDVTEAQAAAAVMERIALSHPEVAFRFLSDGEIKFRTVGDGVLQTAIFAVYGKDFAGKMIALEGDFEGVGISGFIGRSDNVRGNRNLQNFFINGRWVKSKTAMAALEQAYTSYMPAERFPVCVLNITLNPARVDVNVHPAKMEVRFSNEKPVFEAVYYAVRHALDEDSTRPAWSPVKEKPGRVSDAFAPIEERGSRTETGRQMTVPALTAVPGKERKTEETVSPQGERFSRLSAEEYLNLYRSGDKKAAPPATPCVTVPHLPQYGAFQARETLGSESSPAKTPPHTDRDVPPPETADRGAFPAPSRPSLTEIGEEDKLPRDALPLSQGPWVHSEPVTPRNEAVAATEEIPTYRIVGEVFQTYVVVEDGDRMLLIDKHAAHERLLFEDMKKQLAKTEISSQMLLLPAQVTATGEEINALREYGGELERLGFSLSYREKEKTVQISALPVGIEAGAAGDMLLAIADQILTGTGSATVSRDILFEKALYQGACKAAIKGGKEYPEEQIQWLVKELMRLGDVTFCPHGRPVAMEITRQKLNHQFERC